MLVELWGNIPEDFEYSKIDRRVMRFGVELTLLGILHVDPTTELVDETDQVIQFVRDRIRKEPSISAISSEQTSESLSIPEVNVALIFALLSHLGDFWNGGAGHGDKPGYYTVTIKDETVKRSPAALKSNKQALANTVSKASVRHKDSLAFQNHARLSKA